MKIRMPCHTLCGYSQRMHRPHATCLWCRLRRFFYGKINEDKYVYRTSGRISFLLENFVMPKDFTTYVIFIDNQRSHANIKGAILKRLLTICEALAN